MKRPRHPASGACRQVCLRTDAHFRACRSKCATRRTTILRALARGRVETGLRSLRARGGVLNRLPAASFSAWAFFLFLEVLLRLCCRQRRFSAATPVFASAAPATLQPPG